MGDATTFTDLDALAAHLRQELETKKFILLYAYNGTGKTRLSTAFKDLGQSMNPDGETHKRDTLYFNAFTEDLFSWDNDLENDSERKLKLNTDSSFFGGLESMEMDNRIRTLLGRYADFDFRIDTAVWEVVFARELRVKRNGTAGDEVNSAEAGQGEREDEYETRREEAIKVSRGEENMFIWCFFLAIVELALDDDGTGPYNWVKHIYIDDPISSLDEHNAIAVANHLAKLLKRPESRLKTVISTHHPLFFNVLCNELNNASKYFLSRGELPGGGSSYARPGIPHFSTMWPHSPSSTRPIAMAGCTRITSTCSAQSWRRPQVFMATRTSLHASNAMPTIKMASFTHG
jgi:hypothetical protein